MSAVIKSLEFLASCLKGVYMPDFIRKNCWKIALGILLLAFLSPAPSLRADEGEIPIEVSGDQLEYVRQENKIVASGNVIVSYKNLKLTCDKAEVYTDTKKAYAEGHVYIYQETGEILRGDKVFYDFKNRQGSFPNGKVVTEQWYGRGDQIEQVSEDEIRVYNASVTTCPYDRPHYDVKAKRVTIYPDDKIVARDVVFRILGRPIFWWPYFIIPLDLDEPPFELAPGYSSEHGFYVLGSKATSLNKNVKLKGHLDYRSKRGVAGGVDARYRFDKLGEGTIQTYITEDDRAPNPEAQGNPFRNKKNDDGRGRASFRHRMDIDPNTHVIAEWHYFSDEFFLQDFFEREFRRELEPESFVTFTKNTDRYGFLVDVQKRTNRFFSTVERLPEVKFTWNRREIMNTNFYYRAEHDFVNFNKKFARSALDEDVVRFDTFHEISYPMHLLGLEVVPFGNARESWYSKNKFGEEGIERHVLGNGVDVSTRFYKVYDVETNFLSLELNKLRHVLEPSFRYDAIREVSIPEGHLQVFEGIDDLFNKDELTFGFENRFQTKRFRSGAWQRVDVVSFNTFLTYSYDDFFIGNSQWSKWRQEIELRPYDWLATEFVWEYDMVSDQFRFADIDIIWEKDPIRLLLNHRFDKQDVNFGGRSLLTFDAMYRLSPLWSVGGYMRTEFDSGQVEEWEIRASRDLHDWYLDFGYNVRNSDIDSSNKEVFIELRLKAFPQFPLKAGNRASFSRPRIGHFVSGANEPPSLLSSTSTTPEY